MCDVTALTAGERALLLALWEEEQPRAALLVRSKQEDYNAKRARCEALADEVQRLSDRARRGH